MFHFVLTIFSVNVLNFIKQNSKARADHFMIISCLCFFILYANTQPANSVVSILLVWKYAFEKLI